MSVSKRANILMAVAYTAVIGALILIIVILSRDPTKQVGLFGGKKAKGAHSLSEVPKIELGVPDDTEPDQNSPVNKPKFYQPDMDPSIFSVYSPPAEFQSDEPWRWLAEQDRIADERARMAANQPPEQQDQAKESEKKPEKQDTAASGKTAAKEGGCPGCKPKTAEVEKSPVSKGDVIKTNVPFPQSPTQVAPSQKPNIPFPVTKTTQGDSSQTNPCP